MGEDRRTTYRISEAARELGVSAEWLRVGERRGIFPPALRDRNGHRYYTGEDLQRMRKGRGQGRGQSRHLGPCDDRNEHAVVGGYGVVPASTRFPGSASSAPNATTSAMVAEWSTSRVRLDRALAIRVQPRVDLDDTGVEVHKPGLRHSSIGVEGQLDIPVVRDAGVGHLDHDYGVPRLRHPATNLLPVEGAVRVVLALLPQDERVLHAHHEAGSGGYLHGQP